MLTFVQVLNAYSGFALVAEGLMLDNPLLTTVGSLIGVSGSILSYFMCVAMNRSLTNVLFGGMAAPSSTEHKVEGEVVKTDIDAMAESLMNAESVVIVSPPHHCELIDADCIRWSDTAWLLPKPSMHSPRLRLFCGLVGSKYASAFILWRAACLDSATYCLLRLAFHMTVSEAGIFQVAIGIDTICSCLRDGRD